MSVLRKRDRYRQGYVYPRKRLEAIFLRPDSGGYPISIHCECGLDFCPGTWDYEEAVEQWNRRVNDKEDSNNHEL